MSTDPEVTVGCQGIHAGSECATRIGTDTTPRKERADMVNRMILEVEEVRGSCPLYEIGNQMVIDSDPLETLNLEESDKVCMRALDNLCHRMGWIAGSADLARHLAGVLGIPRIQCPNPGEPYTPCGTVIFRIRREELD